jgi:phenylacetic acid degradation operon negative regulatory protein
MRTHLFLGQLVRIGGPIAPGCAFIIPYSPSARPLQPLRVRQTSPVHARSALFDVYGDYLPSRDDRAPVAALVRLLATLGIAAPAVRTAISRMVRQGWLEPVRLQEGPGYASTARARQRLADAASRIYRTTSPRWDGAWDLLVLDPGPLKGGRAARERVRSGLTFLGYAPLSDTTWISPAPSAEVDEVLVAEGSGLTRFRAQDPTPAAQAARAWDLEALAASYDEWYSFAMQLVEDPRPWLGGREPRGDERAFAVRSVLVHEWRKFLFSDPGLPDELLPRDWPGRRAANLFADAAYRMLPAASRFVDVCLSEPTHPRREI